LTAGELANVHRIRCVDAHALERWPVRDRRNDELARVLKTDESAVEEMIDARREQQSVFAVEPLFV